MKNLIGLLVLAIAFSITAQANVTIINGLTKVNSGKPGENVQGEIIMINTSKTSQLIVFDFYDAIFSCEKDRAFEKDTMHSQSSKNWLNSTIKSMVIPAGEKFTYNYEIRIPSNKVINSTYWSVIMVSVEQPVASREIDNQIGVDSKIRYAVGIITNVNEREATRIKFAKVDLANKKTDAKRMMVKIENEGSYMEGVQLELEIYNSEGELVKKIKTDRNMVFPGFCREYSLNLQDIESGVYECVLVANGSDEYIGSNIQLSL